MKIKFKFFLTLFIVFLCINTNIYAGQKMRVYKDYNPVRILQITPGNDFDLEAQKAGLKGSYSELDISDLPKSRQDRDIWRFESGKIKLDESRQKELTVKKENKKALNKKLSELGFSKEDIEILGVQEDK